VSAYCNRPRPGDAASLAVVADWLAGIFAAPLSPASVCALRTQDGRDLLRLTGDELGSAIGVDSLQAALHRCPSSHATHLAFARAYTALFDGVGGPHSVSLCESAHDSATGRLFGPATGEMEALLRRCGRSVRHDLREPADHLSIELALLTAQLRVGDDAAVTLLQRRLESWTPRAAARCADADTSGFYTAAMTVLGELLAALSAMPTVRDAPSLTTEYATP
jgi:TorA-specific chaperone